VHEAPPNNDDLEDVIDDVRAEVESLLDGDKRKPKTKKEEPSAEEIKKEQELEDELYPIPTFFYLLTVWPFFVKASL
jgi:hypothetical protein